MRKKLPEPMDGVEVSVLAGSALCSEEVEDSVVAAVMSEMTIDIVERDILRVVEEGRTKIS